MDEPKELTKERMIEVICEFFDFDEETVGGLSQSSLQDWYERAIAGNPTNIVKISELIKTQNELRDGSENNES